MEVKKGDRNTHSRWAASALVHCLQTTLLDRGLGNLSVIGGDLEVGVEWKRVSCFNLPLMSGQVVLPQPCSAPQWLF